MAMKRWKKTALVLAVVTVALVLACGIYAGDYYRAEETAVTGSEDIAVEITEDRAVFAPKGAEAGLIFYPGGKVEITAYTPLMAKLAEENVLCVLLKMPMNLAVLDVNAAAGIPEQFRRWNTGIWRDTLWEAAWQRPLQRKIPIFTRD